MTLPKGNGLSENEIISIENAVKDSGIKAVHPEKMEAFAEYLVKKLSDHGKSSNDK